MWKRRVLVTQWAGQAWDDVCKTFNFAGAARKTGMLMTVDGTNDNLILIDGVKDYTFAETDAGDFSVDQHSDDDCEEEEDDDGEEEEEEEEEAEEEEAEVEEDVEEEDDEKDADEEQEGPVHDFGDSDDSEDDTAEPNQVLSFVGAAQAPTGYKILESCPRLETDEDMQKLIGKQILHAWDDKDRQGWFEGKVQSRNLNARDRARAPTANFAVQYRNSLTVGVKKKKTIAKCLVAHELTSRTYGEKKWWVLIVKDE